MYNDVGGGGEDLRGEGGGGREREVTVDLITDIQNIPTKHETGQW